MEQRIGNKIVKEVSAKKGIDPLNLEPLYNTVNPEALNSLFKETNSAPRATGKIEFDYAGYRVTVFADHEISVSKPVTEENVSSSVESSNTSGTVD